MSWITESNRWKHLVLAIPFGFAFTLVFVLGLATGMEFKDVHYHNGSKPIREWSWKCWDWLDWIATVIGGIVGQALQALIAMAIVYNW